LGYVGCQGSTWRNSRLLCIDVSSGIGFCAEHSAVAAMITGGESEITAIVAVWGEDTILPPCGRCRELLNQVHENNLDNTDVIIQTNRAVKLRELLPLPYQETCSADEPI